MEANGSATLPAFHNYYGRDTVTYGCRIRRFDIGVLCGIVRSYQVVRTRVIHVERTEEDLL